MPRSRSKTHRLMYAWSLRSSHSCRQSGPQKERFRGGTSFVHQRQEFRPFGPLVWGRRRNSLVSQREVLGSSGRIAGASMMHIPARLRPHGWDVRWRTSGRSMISSRSHRCNFRGRAARRPTAGLCLRGRRGRRRNSLLRDWRRLFWLFIGLRGLSKVSREHAVLLVQIEIVVPLGGLRDP